MTPKPLTNLEYHTTALRLKSLIDLLIREAKGDPRKRVMVTMNGYLARKVEHFDV